MESSGSEDSSSDEEEYEGEEASEDEASAASPTPARRPTARPEPPAAVAPEAEAQQQAAARAAARAARAEEVRALRKEGAGLRERLNKLRFNRVTQVHDKFPSDPSDLGEYRQLLPRYKEIKAQLECLDA